MAGKQPLNHSMAKLYSDWFRGETEEETRRIRETILPRLVTDTDVPSDGSFRGLMGERFYKFSILLCCHEAFIEGDTKMYPEIIKLIKSDGNKSSGKDANSLDDIEFNNLIREAQGTLKGKTSEEIDKDVRFTINEISSDNFPVLNALNDSQKKTKGK